MSKITHNGFDYNYTYTHFGEPASVKVGSQALATYHYTDYGLLARTTYGNGDYLEYTYDDYARITKVELNNTTTLATYIYNKKNQLTKFIDGKSGETTEYCYDCNGNTLYKYLVSSDGELLRVVNGETEKTTVNGSMRTITNGTDDDGKSYVQNGSAKITSDTDDFGRTTKVATKVDDSPKFSLNYTYKNVGETNRTTNNVHEMTYKLGSDNQLVKYSYAYDANGNIKTINENNLTKYVYTYDTLNQLTRVADSSQYYFFDYTYDTAGNITEKKSIKSNPGGGNLGTTTVEYEYTDSTWGDLLTEYDGQTLTYDNIGNPTSYRDGMTMSWTGRELQSITKDNDTYSFTYNLDGLRTKKNSNGTNTFYYYDDSNNLIGLKKGNTTVLFYYDSEGKVYSMTVGDDTYFFIKDLQGDIRKIINDEGTVVATYAYDAWGALLAENEDSSIEGFNPFRYRGYVYDNETELYYLQSRYYDPKTGRFINADDSAYTDTYSGSPLSTNMFAYCENNAVNGEDPSGRDAYLLQNNKAIQIYNYISFLKKYFVLLNNGLIVNAIIDKTKKLFMGHTSLLIQDHSKNWWYFYWGENKKHLIKVTGYVQGHEYIRVDPTNLKSLNKFLKYYNYSGGDYSNLKRLKGNFYKSLEYIYKSLFGSKTLKSFNTNKTKKPYNLISFNCVQVSLNALCKGTFANNNKNMKIFLKYAKNWVIPNIIYNGIIRFLRISNNYGFGYSMAYYKNVFHFNDIVI